MNQVHNQQEDPYQQRTGRVYRDIDQSCTMIEHLKRYPTLDFPEDFLDDPMPLAPPPKQPPPPQPSTILRRQESLPDVVDMDFVDAYPEKDAMDYYLQDALEPDYLMNQYYPPDQDSEEVIVNWTIKREVEIPAPPMPQYTNTIHQFKAPYGSFTPETMFQEEENQEPMERLLYPVQTYVATPQNLMNGAPAEVRAPLAEKTGKKVERKKQRGPRARFSSIMSATSSGETSRTSPPYTYQPKDPNCPLSAAIDETMAINTMAVCEYIKSELKRLGIQQHLFAARVLCRTQGTLSDLLRNPRPWEEMKSGREPFVRMLNWSRMTDEKKMEVLGLDENGDDIQILFPPPAYGGVKRGSKSQDAAPAPKRPRIIFTETQKDVLDAAFEENREPTKAQQEVLAKQLDLEVKSVANYFTNARRRRRYNAIQKAIKEEVADYSEMPM